MLAILAILALVVVLAIAVIFDECGYRIYLKRGLGPYFLVVGLKQVPKWDRAFNNIIMSVLTIDYSFSMKILHNLFKLGMKRFVIVRNLLYVTACLTKLHIIARCVANKRLASG